MSTLRSTFGNANSLALGLLQEQTRPLLVAAPCPMDDINAEVYDDQKLTHRVLRCFEMHCIRHCRCQEARCCLKRVDMHRLP